MTRDPATLKGDMRVGDALDFFQTRADHRSYPVVDEEGRLIGLVSRTDALRWQAGETPLSATLSETVSDAGLPFAHPDTPIGAIADLIVESGFGRIPIVEPAFRRVVGILSRQDLLKARKFHRIAEERRN